MNTLERIRYRFPNTPFRPTEGGPIVATGGHVTMVLSRPTDPNGDVLDRWTASVIVGPDIMTAQEYTATSPDGDRALVVALRRARRNHHDNPNIPAERWPFGGVQTKVQTT